MPPLKILPGVLFLLLMACNATDSVNHYENTTDSASGPRIDKEQMNAPPDTTPGPPKKDRDSASLRVQPPGKTDTTKLNIQQGPPGTVSTRK